MLSKDESTAAPTTVAIPKATTRGRKGRQPTTQSSFANNIESSKERIPLKFLRNDDATPIARTSRFRKACQTSSPDVDTPALQRETPALIPYAASFSTTVPANAATDTAEFLPLGGAQSAGTAAFVAHTASSVPTVGTLSPNIDLPGWNWLAVGFLFAWLAFMFSVAVIVYFLNFPKHLRKWLRRLMQGERRGYEKIRQGDGEDRGRSSAYRTRGSLEVEDGSGDERQTSPHGARRRKPAGLAIATGTDAQGLGISMPKTREPKAKLRSRRSFDDEALRLRPISPTVSAFQALTAPIPSARRFFSPLTGRSARTPGAYQALNALEEGDSSPPLSSASSFDSVYHDAMRHHSPYHHSPVTKSSGWETPRFLQTVNGGIERMAGRLTRALHDQIKDGPEEGLLLPVRECDRQRNGTGVGVVVE